MKRYKKFTHADLREVKLANFSLLFQKEKQQKGPRVESFRQNLKFLHVFPMKTRKQTKKYLKPMKPEN
jgi:hypothetical protein